MRTVPVCGCVRRGRLPGRQRILHRQPRSGKPMQSGRGRPGKHLVMGSVAIGLARRADTSGRARSIDPVRVAALGSGRLDDPRVWRPARAVSSVSPRELTRPEILRRVRRPSESHLCWLRCVQSARAEILWRMRRAAWRAGWGAAEAGEPGVVHAQAPRREDPHVQGRAGGRAQAGHRALRRPQGLDGAARRPRPRGGAQAPRPRARTHDGGRPPLRGHGEPGDGRRDHGALRRAAGPRGSRRARVLRRAPDAGVAEALRGRHAPRARGGGADPGRPQLGRGRRRLGRQRSPHGLHGRGPDDPPRGPDGTAGAARDRPADRRDRAARRGLRRGAVARAHPREGPRRTRSRSSS